MNFDGGAAMIRRAPLILSILKISGWQTRKT